MSARPETTPTIRHPRRPLIARTGAEGHRQATWLELFFDLCFVVAIAALARAFHGDPTWEGAAIFVGLFIPLWWTWIAFTWFGNTFDNDDVFYRGTVFVGMLSIVWLASSLEAAAEGRGFAFALAYIALQSLVVALNVRARMHVPAHPDVGTHDLIAGWLNRQLGAIVIGLVPWVVSLAVDGTARYALWAAGLVIHVMGPYVSLRVFEADQAWHVEEHHTDRAKAAYGVATPDEPLLPVTDIFHLDHIQERYGLFTIIVLGESVLAVSIGISEVGWNITAMLTASLAFLAAVSIWWTYFDRAGRDALTTGLGASFVWGYGHLAIFAGIAALGVGTELMIEAAAAGGAAEHAADEEAVGLVHGGGLPGTAIFAGGAAAFWIGITFINLANLGFRLTAVGRWFIPARLGLAAALVGLAFADIDPLPFAAAAGGLMLALNAVETAAVYRFQQARATAAKGATT